MVFSSNCFNYNSSVTDFSIPPASLPESLYQIMKAKEMYTGIEGKIIMRKTDVISKTW